MQYNNNNNVGNVDPSLQNTISNLTPYGFQIEWIPKKIQLSDKHKDNINLAIDELNHQLRIQSKGKLDTYKYLSRFKTLTDAVKHLDLSNNDNESFQAIAKKYEPFRHLFYYDGNELAEIAYHTQSALTAIENALHSQGQGAHIKETDSALRKKKIQLEKLKEKCISAMLEHLTLRYQSDYVGEGLLYKFLGEINLLASKKNCRDKLDSQLKLNEGCDVIVVDEQPTQATLQQIPTKSNAAYVYYDEKIYYINKSAYECSLLKFTPHDLKDAYHYTLGNTTIPLPSPSKTARTLSKDELFNIKDITKHEHQDTPTNKIENKIEDNNLIHIPSQKKIDQKKEALDKETKKNQEKNHYLYTVSMTFLNAMYDGMVKPLMNSLVQNDGKINCLPSDTKNYFVLFISEFGSPQDRTTLSSIQMENKKNEVKTICTDFYGQAKQQVNAMAGNVQQYIPVALPTSPTAEKPTKPELIFSDTNFSCATFFANIEAFQKQFTNSGYDFLEQDRLNIVKNTVACVTGFEMLLGEDELAIHKNAKNARDKIEEKKTDMTEAKLLYKAKVKPAANLIRACARQKKLIDNNLNVSTNKPYINCFNYLRKVYSENKTKLNEIDKIEQNWLKHNKYANLSSSALVNLTNALSILEIYCKQYVANDFINNDSYYETTYRRPINGLTEQHINFVRQNIGAMQKIIAEERKQIADEMLHRLELIGEASLKRIVLNPHSTEFACNDFVRHIMAQLLPFDTDLFGSASKYFQSMPPDGLSRQNRQSILDANSFIERHGSEEAKARLKEIFDSKNYPQGIPFSTVAVDDEIGEFDIMEIQIAKFTDKEISDEIAEFIELEKKEEPEAIEENFEFIAPEKDTKNMQIYLDYFAEKNNQGDEKTYIEKCIELRNQLNIEAFTEKDVSAIAYVLTDESFKSFTKKLRAKFNDDNNYCEAILIYAGTKKDPGKDDDFHVDASVDEYLKKYARENNISNEDYKNFESIVNHLLIQYQDNSIEDITKKYAEFKKNVDIVKPFLDNIQVSSTSGLLTLNNTNNNNAIPNNESYTQFFIDSYWYYFQNNAVNSTAHALADSLICMCVDTLASKHSKVLGIFSTKQIKSELEKQPNWDQDLTLLTNNQYVETNLSKINTAITSCIKLMSEKRMIGEILHEEIQAVGLQTIHQKNNKKTNLNDKAPQPLINFLSLIEGCKSFQELENILKDLISQLPDKQNPTKKSTLLFQFSNSAPKIRKIYSDVVSENTLKNKK